MAALGASADSTVIRGYASMKSIQEKIEHLLTMLIQSWMLGRG